MDLYISMAFAVLFQILKDKNIAKKHRAAFMKIADAIYATFGTQQAAPKQTGFIGGAPQPGQ